MTAAAAAVVVVPGLCQLRRLPSATATAAMAFSPGLQAMLDAVRAGRVHGVIAAVPGALLGAPSAVVVAVFRTFELALRRTVHQVRYDGRVLFTVVPYRGPRPGALAWAAAVAAAGLACLLLATALQAVLALLSDPAHAPVAATLALFVVAPLLWRLPPRSCERALRAYRDSHGASVLADVARAPWTPPGTGVEALSAYLAWPGRPPVVGLATETVWTKVYRTAGLSATALPCGPLQSRGLRRRLVLVHD